MDKKIMVGVSALVGGLTLTGASSATATVKYSYDAKGRLTKVERSGSVNNGVKTEYSRDKAYNRTNVKTTGSTSPPPP